MKPVDPTGVSIYALLPVFCVLAVSTIFNIALTWNDFQVLSRVRRAIDLQHHPGQNEVPLQLDRVVQLVDANAHYGMSADEEWESLLPSNHGSGIHLSTTDGHGKFISVYHQLSCLNSLRQLYMNPGWSDDLKKRTTAHHCLNVLRQAVLCNGDTTLEPSHTETLGSGKSVAAASGMGVLHVCRDWERLRASAESDNFASSHSMQRVD